MTPWIIGYAVAAVFTAWLIIDMDWSLTWPARIMAALLWPVTLLCLGLAWLYNGRDY